MELTHVNEKGEARMVDISEKPETSRCAIAQAIVNCKQETIDLIISGNVPKGDVFSCARIAGIMAAKKTDSLIPMCHQLPLSSVTINLTVQNRQVYILAKVSCTYKTGVEMEAIVAASVAAMTVYDMCKAVDKDMVISEVMLLSKTGGKSGTYSRSKIVAINTKQTDLEPLLKIDSANLIPELGMEGDVKSGKLGRQISILPHDLAVSLKDMKSKCAKRFWANIEVSEISENIAIGDYLKIGTATVCVTQVGKECSVKCDTYEEGKKCAYIKQLLFAKVVEEGTIKIHDSMYKEV
jgi:cyclic pyranopterin monophosphate synthase